jgi:hypothetical protein
MAEDAAQGCQTLGSRPAFSGSSNLFKSPKRSSWTRGGVARNDGWTCAQKKPFVLDGQISFPKGPFPKQHNGPNRHTIPMPCSQIMICPERIDLVFKILSQIWANGPILCAEKSRRTARIYLVSRVSSQM